MKLIKFMCFSVIIVFVMSFFVSVYALAAPYSLGTSRYQCELRERLLEYIDNFSSDSIRGRSSIPDSEDYQLKYRQVIWPKIDNPNLVFHWGSFSEAGWGEGVNNSNFEWITTSCVGEWPSRYIAVSIFYKYINPSEIYRTRFMYREYVEKLSHEGIYNNIPYYGYTYILSGGEIFTQFNMPLGDVLVRVFDSKPFCESRISLIQFDETELFLPVYVRINNPTPAPTEMPINPNNFSDKHLLLVIGSIFVFGTILFVPIMLIVKKRRRQENLSQN